MFKELQVTGRLNINKYLYASRYAVFAVLLIYGTCSNVSLSRQIPEICKITILEQVGNNASLKQRYITVPYIPDWWLTSYFTARAGDNMT